MRHWIALHAVGSSRTFLMIRKEDRTPLGGVGFGGVGDMQELGYALGRAYWGQGYATEGVLAMLEHARALGLRALEAFTFVENPASARVLRQGGIRRPGRGPSLLPQARRHAQREASSEEAVGRQQPWTTASLAAAGSRSRRFALAR